MIEFNQKDISDMAKDWIESSISYGIWYIEFEKKDGSTREMWCTRDVFLLPQEDEKEKNGSDDEEPKKVVKPSPNINVFDLDVNAWRSFRPLSLIKATRKSLNEFLDRNDVSE